VRVTKMNEIEVHKNNVSKIDRKYEV
jgi:hypothetical protein